MLPENPRVLWKVWLLKKIITSLHNVRGPTIYQANIFHLSNCYTRRVESCTVYTSNQQCSYKTISNSNASKEHSSFLLLFISLGIIS